MGKWELDQRNIGANKVLVMSLMVTYLPLFMPPPGGAKTATGTEPPAPAAL
jgi:hypothetical protein